MNRDDDDDDNGKYRGNEWPFYLGALCCCCFGFGFLIWLIVLTVQTNDLSSQLSKCCPSNGQANLGGANRIAAATSSRIVQDPEIVQAVQRGAKVQQADPQRWSRLANAKASAGVANNNNNE